MALPLLNPPNWDYPFTASFCNLLWGFWQISSSNNKSRWKLQVPSLVIVKLLVQSQGFSLLLPPSRRKIVVRGNPASPVLSKHTIIKDHFCLISISNPILSLVYDFREFGKKWFLLTAFLSLSHLGPSLCQNYSHVWNKLSIPLADILP